jgi:very-short-patch-repair endonuclease
MRLDPWFKQRSRELRDELTPAESILWAQLRGRRFSGLKFRRQHVIGSFIVDFYCAEVSLILEIDGETHLGKAPLDEARQSWLQAQGYRVLRFWNTEVYDELEPVLEAIWQECEARRTPIRTRRKRKNPSPPTPLP